MAQIQPEIESFARIRVIGVGGSGGNAVNHMVDTKVRGVDFIAINTDGQALLQSLAKRKIHIGKNLTHGRGTGMNPEMGKRAADETKEELQQAIKGSDMVFVACGMGGGTGTGAAPVIAKSAKEIGALTVAVVTKPFSFEGAQRARLAEQGIEELRKEVDALIVIPNDRILATVEKGTTLKLAFAICNDVLKQAVEGLSDVITNPGDINVDFNDVRAVMENAGSALMGIGTASGENRAQVAARMAVSSPLLEISINGAKGVLFAIAGGDDLGMLEVHEAAKIITESVDPNAKIIFGTSRDDKLKKGEVRVTVIATGFPTATAGPAPRGQSLFSSATREKERDPEPAPAPAAPTRSYTAPAPATPAPAPTPTPAPAPAVQQPTVVFKETVNDVVVKTTEAPAAADRVKKIELDDDDWGAVPSFLRRPKIK